jgi:hypothetical protein
MEYVIKLCGTSWFSNSPTASAWGIREGNLKCSACGEQILPGGGDAPNTSDCALPVYSLINGSVRPTNFVCPVCRGLLEPV